MGDIKHNGLIKIDEDNELLLDHTEIEIKQKKNLIKQLELKKQEIIDIQTAQIDISIKQAQKEIAILKNKKEVLIRELNTIDIDI